MSAASAQPQIVQPGGAQVITPEFVPARPKTPEILPAIVTIDPAAEKKDTILPVAEPKLLPGLPKTPQVMPAVVNREPVDVKKVAIQPVTQVQPLPVLPPRVGGPQDESPDINVRVELPGPQRLFQRDSEWKFFERIAHEKRNQKSGSRTIFPEEPVISKEKHAARTYGAQAVEVEPCYLTHGRLYFEQPNFERAGYDLGILTPGINVGVFLYDTLLWPYHIGTDWRRSYDCSAGNSLKCLPGDPAPFVWPRERFSVTGLVGQSGAIVGGIFLFP